jgi:hypothetical protein
MSQRSKISWRWCINTNIMHITFILFLFPIWLGFTWRRKQNTVSETLGS